MADLYNPLAGVRGTPDLNTMDQAAALQYLRQLYAGGRPDLAQFQNFAPHDGSSLPTGVSVRGAMGSEAQADQRYFHADLGRVGQANQAGNRAGYFGKFDQSGKLLDVGYEQADSGNGADWFTNALIAAGTAAILGGAAGYGPLGGFSGGTPAAAAPAAVAAPAAPGTAPAAGFGQLGSGTAGLGAADAATIPFGDLTGTALIPQGQMSLYPGVVGTAGQGLSYGEIAAGAVGGAAGGAAGAGDAAGAAPITVSQPTTVASPFKIAMDAVKPYASLIGPAMSLVGAAPAQTPQMPQNAGARIPGVEAPPEARGLDRQAARSPILDVLGRNRRSNRNPTLLTGPGGVNMDSVRVGGNTLLGM